MIEYDVKEFSKRLALGTKSQGRRTEMIRDPIKPIPVYDASRRELRQYLVVPINFSITATQTTTVQGNLTLGTSELLNEIFREARSVKLKHTSFQIQDNAARLSTTIVARHQRPDTPSASQEDVCVINHFVNDLTIVPAISAVRKIAIPTDFQLVTRETPPLFPNGPLNEVPELEGARTTNLLIQVLRNDAVAANSFVSNFFFLLEAEF